MSRHPGSIGGGGGKCLAIRHHVMSMPPFTVDVIISNPADHVQADGIHYVQLYATKYSRLPQIRNPAACSSSVIVRVDVSV